mgnify:CR=1 FL=1
MLSCLHGFRFSDPQLMLAEYAYLDGDVEKATLLFVAVLDTLKVNNTRL